MAVLSSVRSLIRTQAHERRPLGLEASVREALSIAFEALRAHKLRSFLTLLGVVIATTTLIVVISVIHGMNLYIADHIANLGANVFILDQYNWGNISDEDWLREQRRNKPMRMEEYEYLKGALQGYKNIGARASLSRTSAPAVRYEAHSLYEVSISGTTSSMIEMGQEEVGAGRYFTDAEYAHSARVCFIGQDL